MGLTKLVFSCVNPKEEDGPASTHVAGPQHPPCLTEVKVQPRLKRHFSLAQLVGFGTLASAPLRSRQRDVKIDKSMIGPPLDFRHLAHAGPALATVPLLDNSQAPGAAVSPVS